MFVTHGMIYVQNSVGRMANTYMETSDNFVDSAFTTTCTYLEKRYFPFEITNTEIVWNNEVQVSSLTIIDLSGNIIPLKCKIINYFTIRNRNNAIFN